MLTTVEAEIDTSGNVRLLEPVEVKKTTRAIVTLLEDANGAESDSNGNEIVNLLKNPEFANRKSYSTEEIEARIEELRNSWE